MSYLTIYTIKQDPWIRNRVSACVSVESVEVQPEEWVSENSWALAAQPGWSDAWEYALNIHQDDPSYQPGRDESVITDGMILSAVQAINGT